MNLGLGAKSQRIDQPLQEGPRFQGTPHRHARLRNRLALLLCDTDLRLSPVRALPLAGVRRARQGLDDRYHSAVRLNNQPLCSVR